MEDSAGSAKTKCSREYYFNLVEGARTDDDIADLITFFGTVEDQELEVALPSMCLLAEKCSAEMKGRMLDLIHCSLSVENAPRSMRKAVFTCLKTLISREESGWNDFFTLAQCLEEPQFHIINPVLPRLDVVLKSVYSNSLEFRWAKLLFIRAFAHSNGWVRLWALEKLLEVEPRFLAEDQDFLFSVFLEHLNCNDPFWRLLERQSLKSFIKSLTNLLDGILTYLDEDRRENFIRKILRSVAGLSSPSSLFFISEALFAVRPFRCLCKEDFHLMISLAQKTSHIQHITMKNTTVFNFVVFFSKMLQMDKAAVVDLGVLTNYFSRDDPVLFDRFIRLESLNEVLRTGYEPTNVICELLDHQRDFQKDDFASLLWARAALLGQEDQLQKLIELELADRLLVVEEGVDAGLSSAIVYDVDALLTTLFFSPRELDTMDNGLVEIIHGYILLRCAVTGTSDRESYMVSTVYVGILKRTKHCFKPLVDIAITLISEEGIEFSREGVLVRLLADVVNYLTADEKKDITPKVKSYLGEDFLAPVRRGSSSTFSPHTRDANKTLSLFHQCRLRLAISCVSDSFRGNPKVMLEECCEHLECASSYSVADCYLEICRMVIDQVHCPKLLLTMVSAAFNVTNEERKSQYFLPALKQFFRICLTKSVMSQEKIKSFVLEKCAYFMDLAQLNATVALYLSRCLADVCRDDLLSEEWVPTVFDLAVFGPIPKKEVRVINAAYDMIYESRPNNFYDIHRPFEVIQCTRLNGICTALHMCKSSMRFAERLVSHMISEIKTLNTSSSRSFGLSLAHRVNTRAASLLLLAVEYVQNEAVIDEVFSSCVDWIADPCQQFSIKLLLEWLLVRLASRSESLNCKLIGLESVFANRRIGSVSSWINMITLISRSQTDKSSPAQYVDLVVPWTTAQNFAVRCTAIAALRLMYKSIPEEEKKHFDLVRRIVEFDGEPAKNSQRIIDNLVEDFYFGHLHPEKHFDLQSIFLVLPQKTGMPPEETIGVDLLKAFNTSSVRSLCDDQQFLSAPSLVYSALSKSSRCAPEMNDEELTEHQEEQAGGSLVQRKIITEERNNPEDCSLVVVASLVDKANNLGGLCRTCEIFGVDELVIADTILASDTGFKALSMSSEKKQKIGAVRPESLLEYLGEMRSKGYSVIAAEQTTDSVYLHKFNFPKKTVLLVGDEKEGVPVHLLRCVDQTVEIQQFGQTRMPVFINFAFLLFAMFSLGCYSFCWRRMNPLFVLPILIYECVTIFWIMIWLYASITAITTGYLWSLEWIGGPQSSRRRASHDVLDENYVNPNETNPETTKAIKFGTIILAVSLVILILKVFAFSIARRVFREIRKEYVAAMEEAKGMGAVDGKFPKDRATRPPVPAMELKPMLEKKESRRSPSPRESYI
ncbi:hypothetical protein Q1695_010978 [Nippostrongylus brasiliensis]|nr:hypothetical protein Q1695_010978 [Nippostrongylus brasiliensis]